MQQNKHTHTHTHDRTDQTKIYEAIKPIETLSQCAQKDTLRKRSENQVQTTELENPQAGKGGGSTTHGKRRDVQLRVSCTP